MDHVPWPVIPSLRGGIAEWRATLAHGIEQSGTYFARQAWCPWPAVSRVETLIIALVEIRPFDFIGLSMLRFTGPDGQNQRIFWPCALIGRNDASDPRNFAGHDEAYYLRSTKLTGEHIAFEIVHDVNEEGLLRYTGEYSLLVHDASMDGVFDYELLNIINGVPYGIDYTRTYHEPHVHLLSWPHYPLQLLPERTWVDDSTCTDGQHILRLHRVIEDFPEGVYAPAATPDLRAYLMFGAVGKHYLLATLHQNEP